MGKRPEMKAYDRLMREQSRQIGFVYSAACIVLKEKFGFDFDRIDKVCQESQKNVNELVGNYKSTIQVLDEETGIELTLPGKKSYEEYAYLYSHLWGGEKRAFTAPQLIYMYNQMIPWVPVQMLASICLALHKTEGFEYDQLAEFVSETDKIRYEWGTDAKKYKKELEERVDADPSVFFGE